MDAPSTGPMIASPCCVLRIASHPALHPVFESLAYFVGFAAYRGSRNSVGDTLSQQKRWTVIAAAVLGALVGSRLLGFLEQLPRTGLPISALFLPGGGKTIVGGLLGGWAAVELAKKLSGIRTRTGDLFAIPLCIGIAVGRVGCLLAGLADDTYGKPTGSCFGVDFGDGIARHPTQLYEIVFLALLAFFLRWLGRRPHAEGVLFRVFLGSYLTWRFLIDFCKPQPLVAGMNLIQWACLIGLAALTLPAVRHFTRSEL